MEAGQVIELGPGEVITCVRSAREGGAFENELELAPGVKGPPTHRHLEDEEVEILEGELVMVVDGTPHHLRAGDTLLIPAGTPHTFAVPKGAGPLRARGRCGIRFERVVDQHSGDGARFTRMARYLCEVDPDASYMVSPFVRGLLRLVAWFGRLRGVQLHPTR